MRSRSAFLNAACAPQILEKQAVKCGGAPVPVHSHHHQRLRCATTSRPRRQRSSHGNRTRVRFYVTIPANGRFPPKPRPLLYLVGYRRKPKLREGCRDGIRFQEGVQRALQAARQAERRNRFAYELRRRAGQGRSQCRRRRVAERVADALRRRLCHQDVEEGPAGDRGLFRLRRAAGRGLLVA